MNDSPDLSPISSPSFTGLIGAAQEDITPPVGILARNWGAAHHDTAEGIHRPLVATALTLQRSASELPLVLVSLDLGWWRRPEDEWRLRSALLEALSLPVERVVISLSHTHSGPSICQEDSGQSGGAFIGPYLDRVRDAVVAASRRAMAAAELAVLTWGVGVCSLAANRDLPEPSRQRIVCGFNPSVPADDTLVVGRVTSIKRKILATLVNYACHPVTLAWQNRHISPDFVGAMREVVETHTGGSPCLFLQGASGELAPREQYSGELALADRHGRRLGFAALATLEGMLPPAERMLYGGVVESGAPLFRWDASPLLPSSVLEALCREVELPLKEMPSVEEINEQRSASQDRVLSERLLRQRRVRETVGDGNTAPMPLWAWRIGDGVLVAQPNEAYSQFQTALRERFPQTPLVVINLANGSCGYLPPDELYSQDCYQVNQTPFAPGSLERLIHAAQDSVQDLLK